MPFSIDDGSSRSHEEHEERFVHKALRDHRVSSGLREKPSWTSSPEPQPLSVVAPLLNLDAPVAVLDVPLRRCRDALLERVRRRPPELAADSGRVDGVPPIVPGPIGHERFQIAIAPAAERGIAARWRERLEHVADAIDDLEIGPLVAAADIILFAHSP